VNKKRWRSRYASARRKSLVAERSENVVAPLLVNYLLNWSVAKKRLRFNAVVSETVIVASDERTLVVVVPSITNPVEVSVDVERRRKRSVVLRRSVALARSRSRFVNVNLRCPVTSVNHHGSMDILGLLRLGMVGTTTATITNRSSSV